MAPKGSATASVAHTEWGTQSIHGIRSTNRSYKSVQCIHYTSSVGSIAHIRRHETAAGTPQHTNVIAIRWDAVGRALVTVCPDPDRTAVDRCQLRQITWLSGLPRVGDTVSPGGVSRSSIVGAVRMARPAIHLNALPMYSPLRSSYRSRNRPARPATHLDALLV